MFSDIYNINLIDYSKLRVYKSKNKPIRLSLNNL